MNIGFIGVGHMAGSILRAITNKNDTYFVNDHHEDRLRQYKKELGSGLRLSNYKEILENSEFVFLGVKPKQLKELLYELKEGGRDVVFVSMAAGFSIEEMAECLGPDAKIIRIMPNTPVAVGKGVTFFSGINITDEIKCRFLALLKPTGTLYEIDESKMDLVSVLTGSTPAYLDYFIDALAQFGEEKGLSKEEATTYVLKMAEGTIALCQASDKTPLELGREVCSPGGSTIEGVNHLLENGFTDITKVAAEKSYAKTKQMK